jgi:histidine ammonia-lyase
MDSMTHQALILDGQPLTLAAIEAVSLTHCPVAIAPTALARVAQSRALIEEILAAGQTAYGVNTGFGKLSEVRIPADKLAQLQTNLVRSHAGGVGQPLSEAESRAMLLLRANVLAKGFSGCRPALVELLVALLNAGVHPVVPEKGSVGASGDLAPLAHLALVTIGEGEAFYKGERVAGGEALRRAGLQPIVLAAKEGLALLNGTQAMTAVGTLAIARGRRDEPGGPDGHASGLRSAHPPGAATCRTDSSGGTSCGIACRLADSRVAPGTRFARARRLLPSLHAAGARGRAGCTGTCAGRAGD